ncbi:hypothetical protein [Lentibacter sp. XHP0401]|uniref:hypothetical protein n=1 Tax=Lentibacter sp. XHP0401 TaxID=2984334 RepID=UPI0021E99B24|nr:hypothetical protein [Lentibacter sp. XHP0401]MCV2893348.1 hypothetical protein [Lentibacter sp. XHP0401]
MPRKHQPTITNIEPTKAELQKLREEVSRENKSRDASGLPPFNEAETFDRRAAKLADDKFEELLEPYLVAAYEIYTGSPGVANRLKQHIDVYQHAEKAMLDDTGLRRPNPKPFNMMKFLSMYFGEELPVASRRNR